MLDWNAIRAYFWIFILLVAAGFGFPMPEEIPVVTAGAMVGHAADDPDSSLRWWIMLPVCIFGVVLSDSVLYAIGRIWGTRLLEVGWVQHHVIPPAKQERIERNFHSYGIGILMIARFLPGIRTPIFIMSGVMRVPVYKFILADGLYALPGVSLLFWLAYLFGNSFVEAVKKLEDHRPLVIMIVLAAVAGILLYILIRRQIATGDPEKVPWVGRQLSERLHHLHEEEEATQVVDPSELPASPHPHTHPHPPPSHPQSSQRSE